MKYVALLRGVNVGGNNSIKMNSLVHAFEKEGFTNVSTYIQSGNVIFESGSQDKESLVTRIEHMLTATFRYPSTIVLRSEKELHKIISHVPDMWKKDGDLRCYILFVKEPMTAEEVAKEIETKEGIDFLSIGNGALYMGTKMEGITKSKFSKFIGKKVYKDVTMRNYKTSRIILEIMEEKIRSI
jgi:uncharacterized protein (DUF1697 family)